MIESSVEIGRAPEVVFPYVTDPAHFGEWQEGVVSGATEGPGGVGSLCTMTRKIGGSERTSMSKITEYEPPRRWAIEGIDGPIRADVRVLVDPVSRGGGSAELSRVTISLDFHGHGFGKLIAPMVRSQARKEVPESCQKLKARLEQP
jgi:hypothetical protein